MSAAERIHRLAAAVITSVEALRSETGKRLPLWVSPADRSWYVVAMTTQEFDAYQAWRRTAVGPARLRVTRCSACSGDHEVEVAVPGSFRCSTNGIEVFVVKDGPRLGQPDEIEGCE